ncbi:MAG: imidazole glycerol phosphate synthase cyclase subunit [Rhodospirillales bacterium]|nr:imidazole glycerol phosphate synthase cyclase subunit [Rhodospirillales bacterium]
MSRHRLIATLLVYKGDVVQTRRFKRTNMVGSAFAAVEFFNAWAVDEIMVLEISDDDRFRDHFLEIVEELSRRCFVPLTVGGKIADLERVRAYTRAGADKVVINSGALRVPGLLEEVAAGYGSQALVVSIDARPDAAMPSGYRVMIGNGREETEFDAIDWARRVVARGAGELMVNSTEHDGNKRGYDLELTRRVAAAVDVPVIAMGGVGDWQHMVDGIVEAGADAVAAGNIFHYTEHSTKKAKEYLIAKGLDVRIPTFYKISLPRRPRYRTQSVGR